MKPLNNDNNGCKIYGLKDPESEQIRYIGYTKRDLEERLKEHLTIDCRFYKGNWINSLRKKEILPVIELIEDGISEDEIFEKEIYYIKLFKSFGAVLTNMNEGGRGGLGFTHSEETKEQLRQSKLGDKNPFYGKKHNTESLKKAAAKRLGEQNGFYGKQHSEETKQKIRARLKGKPSTRVGYIMSEEAKLKVSIGNTGKVRSDELKNQISAKLKGRVFTKEHKQKIKDAWINRKSKNY